MRNTKLIITSVVVCLNLYFSQAQEYVLHFQNITTKQGLSDNRVIDVLQDSTGLIWGATKLAINKYNGEKTEIYPLNRGCLVHQLLEDRKGNIMAATTKGIYIYDGNKNAFFYLNSKNKNLNEFLNGNITKIVATNDGYWLINDSSLVGFKMDGDFNIIENTIKIIKNKIDSNYTTIIEDSSNNLWLGTDQGNIFLFDHLTIKPINFPNYINNLTINDMVMDATNTLWIATDGNGLFRLNLKNQKVLHYFSENSNSQTINNNIILSLLVDKNDNIWIGTDGGGLNLYEKQIDSFHYFQQSFNNDNSLLDNAILSINHGLDNTLLLSTVFGGISILDNHLDIMRISPDKLGFNYKDGQSSVILEDSNKNIWLSAGREGLRKYNPKTKQVILFIDDKKNQTGFRGQIVLSLFEDKEKRIWIGTLRDGLNIYDTSKKVFLSAIDSKKLQGIYSIKETNDGTIWVGYRGGIHVYDMDLNLIKQIQVGTKYTVSNTITTIYKDVKGDMWVGTENGLHRYKKTATGYNKLSYYSKLQDSTTLSSNHILSIAETKDFSLLIGTYGNGVNTYSRSKNEFLRLKTKSGIDNSIIWGILKDQDENIWLSTNTGLAKINSGGSITNLSANKRIQAFNGGAATLSNNGAILMAGSQGLTYFFPNELKHNSPLPKVFFTSASILNDGSINQNLNLNTTIVNTPIELTHNTVLFSIKFSSSYFYNTEQLQYAYILEGLDNSWHTIENTRSLNFSSLNPGDYTLKIKVANDLGYGVLTLHL